MGNAGGTGVEWQDLYEQTERKVEEALKYHEISTECIKMQQELIRTLAAENLHLRDTIARGSASRANMVPSPPHLTTCKVQGPQVIQRPAQPVIRDIRVAGYALELYFDRPREEGASSPVTFRAYLYDKGRTGEALAEGRSSPLCMTGLKTGEDLRFVLVAVHGEIEGPESIPSNAVRLEVPTRVCVDCVEDIRPATESFIQERLRAAIPSANLVFTPAAEAEVVFVTCEIRDRIPPDLGQRIARHAGKRIGILMIHIMSSPPTYRQEVTVESHIRGRNPVFDLVRVDGAWYTQTQKDAIRELVAFVRPRS